MTLPLSHSVEQQLSELNSVLEQFDDLVDAGAKDIYGSTCNYSAEDIRSHIANMQKQERLLKIGIIGRVKAGKSSLINALLFEGRDVLPKAATPMTAALTTVTYSNVVKAEVEFFSVDEIGNIRRKALQFQQEVSHAAEAAAAMQRQRSNAVAPPVEIDMSRLRDSAARQVSKNNPVLKSADEIYQRLKQSTVSVESLPERQVLEADSIEALREKLYDYVGADGTYMPFTRTLHIGLPVEGLRNLEVVDTPGLNDAVASREQRTYEMLKECNVVFVISPAGQFLHEQDQELANRLSKREGIQEIYLVASKIDEQLHSSERDRFGGMLPEVVAGVKGVLAKQATSTLRNSNNPVLTDIADKLNQRLFVTAGIAQTLLAQPESEWDEAAIHALGLLKRSFPDYFADQAQIEASLELLAGRSPLLKVISSVYNQKEAILDKQIKDFVEAQQSSIQEALGTLIEHFQHKKSQVADIELSDTEAKVKHLAQVDRTGAGVANTLFNDSADELSLTIGEELKGLIKQFRKDVKGDVDAAESTMSESYRREKDGVWSALGRWTGMGGYEDATRTVTTFQARDARSALEDMRDFIESGLKDIVEIRLLQWRKKLAQDLSARLRDAIGDDMVEADKLAAICRMAVREVRDLPKPDIPELPAELAKGGKLKGREAEEYLDAAVSYLSSLVRKANHYADDIKDEIAKLANFNIGDPLFIRLREEAEKLQMLVKNKRLTIEKLGLLTQKLREI